MPSGKIVDASVNQVVNVLLDFASYPDWSGIDQVSILQHDPNANDYLIKFQLNFGGVQDEILVLVTQPDPSTILWSLQGSSHLNELHGKFELSQIDSYHCRVFYELELRFKNPIMNMMKKTIEGQMIDKLLDRLAKRAAQS